MTCCSSNENKTGVKDTANGIAGNWEFLDGILVSDEIKIERRLFCNNCEKNLMGVCTICKCVIALKATLAASECPEKKWGIPDQYKKGNHDAFC